MRTARLPQVPRLGANANDGLGHILGLGDGFTRYRLIAQLLGRITVRNRRIEVAALNHLGTELKIGFQARALLRIALANGRRAISESSSAPSWSSSATRRLSCRSSATKRP